MQSSIASFIIAFIAVFGFGLSFVYFTLWFQKIYSKTNLNGLFHAALAFLLVLGGSLIVCCVIDTIWVGDVWN